MISREELLPIKRIASKVNPRVKDWASLADRKGREALGMTLAEGAKLAGEGLGAGADCRLRPVALLVGDSGAERPEAGGIFELAGRMGVERFSLADDCFAKVSGLKNGDGLALVVATGEAAPDLAGLWNSDGSRWLVAAEVQDPGNAGALARTALAAGFDGCLFLGGADPLSPKFLRGSMGAAFHLPCIGARVEDFINIWPRVEGGRMLVATVSPDATEYSRATYTPPLALVIGGERGVPGALAALPREEVHIPLRGGVESLNLAVAAGIILFEAGRRPGAS